MRDSARWLDVCNGYDARDRFSLPRLEGWEAGLGARGPEMPPDLAHGQDAQQRGLDHVPEQVSDQDGADAALDGEEHRRQGCRIT